jgi:hypothetical protein
MKKLIVFMVLMFANVCFSEIIYLDDNVCYDYSGLENSRIYYTKEPLSDENFQTLEKSNYIIHCSRQNKNQIFIERNPFYKWDEINNYIMNFYNINKFIFTPNSNFPEYLFDDETFFIVPGDMYEDMLNNWILIPEKEF